MSAPAAYPPAPAYVVRPDGIPAGALPGLAWPRLAVRQPRRGRGGRGKPQPVVSLYETDIDEADRLIRLWGHPLKKPAAKRPFGKMSFLLAAFDEPVAVTVSASSPNRSVHQDHALHRYNTVDLARIARRDAPATLAALRLWREYLAPLYAERYAESGWGREPLRAAITYSLPGTPSSAPDGGGIYRRDGWRCLRRRKVTHPGRGSRQGASETAAIADGVTGLWAWIYDPAAA
jgi:hypothetical protein